MTDREILDYVYRELLAGRVHKEVIDFIQTEWQRRDEEEATTEYNGNRNPKDWIIDVREMERHRGLEIGEDGTVKELK
ncbi:MAG: hypothetical protein H8E05_01370 [Bacteroidetes bacterium]|nr:hypothetical protein [Bacteroidota bacterium]